MIIFILNQFAWLVFDMEILLSFSHDFLISFIFARREEQTKKMSGGFQLSASK